MYACWVWIGVVRFWCRVVGCEPVRRSAGPSALRCKAGAGVRLLDNGLRPEVFAGQEDSVWESGLESRFTDRRSRKNVVESVGKSEVSGKYLPRGRVAGQPPGAKCGRHPVGNRGLPGPQMRGTRGTLVWVEKSHRAGGHPPVTRPEHLLEPFSRQIIAEQNDDLTGFVCLRLESAVDAKSAFTLQTGRLAVEMRAAE